mmetsp:Transcript_55800/g.104675  ORF Transcript_55800/g.104675 Transcript_55800/m.104675 type:complete len:88 (+) Transcript_55800:53-316(+)
MVPSFGEFSQRFRVQENAEHPRQERQEHAAFAADMFDDDIAISGTVEAATRGEVERRLAALRTQPQSALAQAVAEAWRLFCRRRYAP